MEGPNNQIIFIGTELNLEQVRICENQMSGIRIAKMKNVYRGEKLEVRKMH